MKFKLIGGNHVENGREYKHGDVIESNHRLDLTFRGKFDRIDDDIKASKGVPAGAPVMTEAVKLTEEREEAEPRTADTDVELEDTITQQPKVDVMKDGKNVTRQFPMAKDEDFRVYLHDKKYFVVDNDTDKVVNPKEEGVAKDEVNTVIKAALKGD